MRSLLVSISVLVAGCSAPPVSTAPAVPPTVCNGHAELCGRTYDAVTFPGTHDAYATHEGQFIAADQTYSMSRQLADGVRVLHLEIQPDQNGVPSLCHASCVIGSQALVDGFREILGFVQAHPAELVSLLMETSNVTRDDVASVLTQSGLAPYLHAQTLGAPWPTLGAMLDKGERVVAFLVADGGSYPTLLDRWSFTWETPWDNEALDDFKRCDVDRGQMGNSIYVVDTYLEDAPIETAMNAERVNNNPFLVDRLRLCHDTTKQLPNFAMVNYYEVGSLFEAVDMMNGFATPPPFDDADFPPVVDGGADGGDTGSAPGADGGVDGGDAGP